MKICTVQDNKNINKNKPFLSFNSFTLSPAVDDIMAKKGLIKAKYTPQKNKFAWIT